MKTRSALLTLAVLLLAACGGGSSAQLAGDSINGQKIFSGDIPIADGNVPNCAGCHAVIPNEPASIGTNLSNIGNRAATEVPGQDAVTYLRTAIVDGDAYLAGGFQEGIHYRGYGEALTEQQINDLIAYLLTLKSGVD
jgi:mono/diheme cytochrome c family protein